MDQKQLVNAIVEALQHVSRGPVRIPVGVSNRHVHLSQPDVERLFGEGYQLQPEKNLSQPGYFAARETVILAGPRGVIQGVRVLGPPRTHSQVEVLRSDTFVLGIQAEIKESGQRLKAQPVTIIGPKGTVVEDMGVLVAKRHIHTNPDDARRLGLREGQLIAVHMDGDRAALLKQVVVRISEGLKTELHLDTEEANAVAVQNGQTVEIVVWPNE